MKRNGSAGLAFLLLLLIIYDIYFWNAIPFFPDFIKLPHVHVFISQKKETSVLKFWKFDKYSQKGNFAIAFPNEMMIN